MAIDIELDMSVDPENEISMTVDDGDEVEIGVGEAIVVKDHAILDNRDLPDQHPISAITGLEDALANIDNMLVVNITGADSNLTADKTFAEIKEAAPNVIAKRNANYYELSYNETYLRFSSAFMTGTHGVNYEYFTIQSDNSVTRRHIYQEIPNATSQLINNSGFITADDIPEELFVVIFFLTGTDPLTVTTTTTAYEVAQAVHSGKALYSVLIAGASMANLTPTTLMSDNGDVLVKFVFNEQSNSVFGIKYFEISMFNVGTPSVNNIKTDPFLTEVTSSNVTTALGYTPVNPSSLATVATTGSYNDLTDKPTIPTPPVTSVNGRTGDVTGLAEASALNNYLNKTTGGRVAGMLTMDALIYMNGQSITFAKASGTPNASGSIQFQTEVDGATATRWSERAIGEDLYFNAPGQNLSYIIFKNDGSIEAKTQATTDNSTKVATTAFVKSVLPTTVSAFTNDAGYLVTNDFVEVTDAQIHAIVV